MFHSLFARVQLFKVHEARNPNAQTIRRIVLLTFHAFLIL